MSDTPANTSADRPSARCPHCDHVFEFVEITDEWCASCGKKIPEIILKDVRPKPHLRHPHPLPEPTKGEQADQSRESKMRAFGLLLVFLAVVVGIATGAWMAYCRINLWDTGITAGWWVGAGAFVLFVVGLGMLLTGRREL